MDIIGIDPGETQSALVHIRITERGRVRRRTETEIIAHAELPNPDVPLWLRGAIETAIGDAPNIVIERVQSYGMPVGREVFDTVRWAGRIEQVAMDAECPTWLLARTHVKRVLLGGPVGGDREVRAALRERFGESALRGVTRHKWAALAVAAAFAVDRSRAVASEAITGGIVSDEVEPEEPITDDVEPQEAQGAPVFAPIVEIDGQRVAVPVDPAPIPGETWMREVTPNPGSGETWPAHIPDQVVRAVVRGEITGVLFGSFHPHGLVVRQYLRDGDALDTSGYQYWHHATISRTGDVRLVGSGYAPHAGSPLSVDRALLSERAAMRDALAQAQASTPPIGVQRRAPRRRRVNAPAATTQQIMRATAAQRAALPGVTPAEFGAAVESLMRDLREAEDEMFIYVGAQQTITED